MDRHDESHSPADVALCIQLLGGFRIFTPDQVVAEDAWGRGNAGRLVKLLALAPGHALHREEIMDRLWPDLLETAPNNLRYTLHLARRTLRQVTPSPVLQLHGERIVLVPGGTVQTDVEDFEAAASKARHSHDPRAYDHALDIYRGELLPDDRYEDWATGRREALREMYLTLLLELSALQEAARNYPQAIGTLQRLILVEPVHEDAHLRLMRLYANTGQRHQALRHYEQLKGSLARELDIDPSPDSERLYQNILAGRALAEQQSGLIVEPALDEARTHKPSRHNLPVALTSFVGRQHEIDDVCHRLETARLLTLVGSGGAGKTRMALEIAHNLLDTYLDGVWLVDLAPLADAELVPGAIAEVFALRADPGGSLISGLVDALKPRSLLLVLDNCEHLAEEVCHLTSTLLESCPDVVVLATSREPLRVPGEVIYRVPSLALPDADGRQSVEALQDIESIALFMDRTRWRQTGFELTSANAPAVAEICRRLDGIPLAIELAAARTHALSVEQIATRLDDALRLLTASSRSAPERHQTLRATLYWSHALLTSDEQVVLRRLSVFAGGWTLEAAESVTNGNGIDEQDVLDLLAHLVDKSLVAVETTEIGVRYRLLETVRQYASELLHASGEADAVRDQHAAYFAALGATAEIELRGSDQELWLKKVMRASDNLRAALSWFAGQGQVEEQLRLATNLVRLWWIGGHIEEGRRWLVPAEDVTVRIDPSARANALAALGMLCNMQGDNERAEEILTQGLAIARELGDPVAIADALNNLGTVAYELGDQERARELVSKSLAIRRELGEPRDIALSLGALGAIVLIGSDYAQAISAFEEALQLYRGVDDRHSMAITINNLGEALRSSGELERAEACFRESLEMFQALDAQHGIAYLHENLANLARVQGRSEEARSQYLQALRLFRDLGYKQALLNVIAGFAMLVADQQPEHTARLFGAESALRTEFSAAIAPDLRPEHERAIATARATLGDDTFKAAWERGRRLALDAAIADAEAIELTDTFDAPDIIPLSPREQQVALLLARGLTNREIATELNMAQRTVDTHVGHILRKLGASSRTEIATRLAGGEPQ